MHLKGENTFKPNCDDCIFYYYSDLRDVCILLKEEVPYGTAVNETHPDCPIKEYKSDNKKLEVEFK